MQVINPMIATYQFIKYFTLDPKNREGTAQKVEITQPVSQCLSSFSHMAGSQQVSETGAHFCQCVPSCIGERCVCAGRSR